MNQNDPTSTENPGISSLNEISVEEIAAQAATETQQQDATTAGTEAAAGPAIPPPIPIPLPKRAVSGRYQGQSGSFRLELRVDVDRVRPMKKLSGDFFTVSGATVSYFGSFIVNSPTITVTATQVIVKGLGTYTFSAGAPVIRVIIDRRTIFQPQAPAQVQFFTTSGSPGGSYNCPFISQYFRSVRLETDRVSDVTTPVLANYNTGSLPSGGPARALSVAGAYAESGIEMVPTAASDVVNIGEAGSNTSWSNAELHTSMQTHFSLFQNIPQWTVWQVVAQKHDIGPGLLGIMFDQAGAQRQGCAVFHQGLGGITATQLRLQLFTYVHELGHCFNLLHSWQKSLANPPQPDRPNSFSYMNYPWGFPAGQAAFWNGFPFQFDDGEIIHLRHAFRNHVIMGGNPFTVGSALEDPAIMQDTIEDQSGLQLEINANQSFALGEPVVLKLALQATDRRGRSAHPYLHPNYLLTTVVVSKPGGKVVVYEPLIDHLMGPSERQLGGHQKLEASAYIGYGKGGLYFDQPGTYQIRGVYQAPDGSRVMSNVASLRVRYPVTARDEELAELLMGEEQGALFYLLGSDNPSLRRGNDAFDKILDKYGDHPLADYVRMAKGVNASRTFKTIGSEPKVLVRKANMGEAGKLLSAAAAHKSIVDDISKAEVIDKLAMAQKESGDDRGASDTLKLAITLTGSSAERKTKAAAGK